MSESVFRQQLLREAAENFSYALGNAALAHQRWDEAVVLYQRAIDVKADNFKAKANLAESLIGIGNKTAGEALRYEAISASPIQVVNAYIDMAQQFLMLNMPSVAFDWLKKATIVDPDNIWVQSEIGDSLWQRGKLLEAVIPYGISVQTKTPVLNAYQYANIGINLCQLVIHHRDTRAIFKAFEHAPIAQDNNEKIIFEVYLQKSAVYALEKKFVEAISEIKKASLLKRDPVRCYQLLSLAFRDINSIHEAQKSLDYAIEIAKNPIENCINLIVHARLLIKQGKETEAGDAFQKAADLYPDSEWALAALAAHRQRQEHFNDAIEAAKLAVANNPSMPWMYIYLGSAFLAAGDRAEALRTWRSTPFVAFNIALAYGRLGDLSEAVSKYEEAQQSLQSVGESLS